jgi:hypothetical protein
MTTDDDSRPEPGDQDFFARFTLSDDIRAAAFGPAGGTPPPRVGRRPGGHGAEPVPTKESTS